jgi:hypothetical protein
MTARHVTLLAVLAFTLSACGAGGADDPDPTTSPPDGAVESSFLSLDEIPDEVRAAIADAAERFDVPEEEVAVAGALRVVWSDGSHGCPAAGMMYSQALVPGYLLTLEVAGQRVAYHGVDGRPPVLCER